MLKLQDSLETQNTKLVDVINDVPDEKSAHDYLAKLRRERKISCPHCGAKRKIHACETQKILKCATCKKHFLVRTGNLFHGSPLTLKKWILAIGLFNEDSESTPLMNLHQKTGTTQKAAGHMSHYAKATLNLSDSINEQEKTPHQAFAVLHPLQNSLQKHSPIKYLLKPTVVKIYHIRKIPKDDTEE